MISIDTGAFLVRHIRRDQYHRRARAAWKALSRLPWRCYTSNFVLDETFTLLARRASYPFSFLQRWMNLVGLLKYGICFSALLEKCRKEGYADTCFYPL